MVCLMRPLPTHAPGARAFPRLRDESGIALVMALGIMLVLTIALTTTIFLTSASARHANSSNAGQKAYALAEAGVNNAIASCMRATTPPTRPRSRATPTLLPTRTTTYDTGSVTWSGIARPDDRSATQWPFEWRITATGTVAEPDRPGHIAGDTHRDGHRAGRHQAGRRRRRRTAC